MVFVWTMKKVTQDNEPLSFITLAAATANVTRYLRLDEKQNEQTDREQNPSNAPNDRVPDNSADIERRVADILAMENRLRRKERN